MGAFAIIIIIIIIKQCVSPSTKMLNGWSNLCYSSGCITAEEAIVLYRVHSSDIVHSQIYISSGPECDVSYSGWEQMKAWVSRHFRSLNFPFAED